MNERTRTAVRAALLLLLAGVGCGEGDGAAYAPRPTAEGSSLGPTKSTTVGPAGGSVVSDDGRLRITIPAGALSEETTIGIEPITDMTRGGEGKAYRLTPHGEVFAVPVTLTFAYSSAETDGSAPENLSLAFQRTDGYWQVVEDPEVDTTNETVAVSTTHFSDWVHVSSYLLTPAAAVVGVGGTVSLTIVDCVEPLPEDPSIAAVVPGCHPIDVADYLLEGGDDWCVNGVPLGNSVIGTLGPSIGADQAVYTAPAIEPAPNTVAVSVVFASSSSSAETTLVSTITIEGDAEATDYAGTVELTKTNLSATGELVFTSFEELPDVSRYLASGTIHGTIALGDCDAAFSFAIGSGTADDPLSSMVVFNELASSPYESSHYFVLQPASETVALDCDGTTAELPASMFVFQVGTACPYGDSGRVYHSDLDHLTGTWSCTGTDLTATWDLVTPDANVYSSEILGVRERARERESHGERRREETE